MKTQFKCILLPIFHHIIIWVVYPTIYCIKKTHRLVLFSSVIMADAQWLHNVLQLKIKAGLGCFQSCCEATWLWLPPNVVGYRDHWVKTKDSEPMNKQLNVPEWLSYAHFLLPKMIFYHIYSMIYSPCAKQKKIRTANEIKCVSYLIFIKDYSRTNMYFYHRYMD